MTSNRIYYTIYETTNLVNGKKYRGAHHTTNPDDNYLGSNRLLTRAIKKHGKENFKKEILFNAFDEESMYWAENIFVDINWLEKKNTYNLMEGGMGGRHSPYCSESLRKKRRANRLGKKLSKETIEKIRQQRIGRKRSVEAKKNMSLAQKKRFETKPLSEERKKQHSDFMKKLWADEKATPMREKLRKRGFSEENLKRLSEMSERNRGKKLSEEQKKKIANSHLGKKHSPETINKLRGRKFSPEHIENIKRAQQKRRKNERNQLTKAIVPRHDVDSS